MRDSQGESVQNTEDQNGWVPARDAGEALEESGEGGAEISRDALGHFSDFSFVLKAVGSHCRV